MGQGIPKVLYVLEPCFARIKIGLKGCREGFANKGVSAFEAYLCREEIDSPLTLNRFFMDPDPSDVV